MNFFEQIRITLKSPNSATADKPLIFESPDPELMKMYDFKTIAAECFKAVI